MTDTYGQQTPATGANDFNLTSFVIQQALLKMQTVTLVKVINVTGGGVAPTGTVDVQPLVNQMTGARVPVAHGTIYGVPFYRSQGGDNAVICDPQPGDIGLCAFASRDISAVKSTKAAANPGSFRTFDFADGLYIGAFLAISPTQYLRFSAEGIELVSPVKVTIQAPEVAVNASTSVTITSPTTTIDGDLHVTGATTGDGEGTFNSIPVSTHVHPGVESGGSNTDPPTP